MLDSKNIKWLSGLDSLRFVMSLIVMIGHSNFIPDYTIDNNANYAQKALKLLPGNLFVGIAAVMVFFVISGIVIHFPYKDGKKIDIIDFYLKRLLRVLIPLSVLFIICSFLDKEIPNVVWSLYCEIIYYLLYPLIHYLFFIKKININFLIVVAFVIAIVVTAEFTDDFSIAFSQNKALTSNFHSLGHHLNWILGLPAWLLGVKISANFNKHNNYIPVYSDLLLLRLLVLIYAMGSSILRFHFAISYKITFIPLFMILTYLWLKNEVLYYSTHRPIKILELGGKWSYSLYLFHMLFIEFFVSYFNPVTIWENLLKLIFTTIMCYIMYRLVEKPSHLIIKKIKIGKIHYEHPVYWRK